MEEKPKEELKDHEKLLNFMSTIKTKGLKHIDYTSRMQILFCTDWEQLFGLVVL